ncbi:hypothetical protein D3C85_1519500 [compost metagenome]
MRGSAVLFEHLPGDVQGLVFQVAAADGVEQAGGADDHFRAGVARGRAAFLDDGNQHAGFATGLVVGEGVDPLVHDADPHFRWPVLALSPASRAPTGATQGLPAVQYLWEPACRR